MTDRRRLTRTPRRAARARGFSLLELLVVLAIVAVMIGVCVPSLVMSQRAYATDDAAAQVIDFLRYAYQKALTERQVMRVRIDTAAGTIQVIDENGAGAGDDQVIRNESLMPKSTVTIGAPVGIPTPPAPYNFATAPVASGPWEIRFRGDGVAVNASGTPQSATLYFYVPTPGDASKPSLVSAVTIFGPGVSVKAWTLVANAFVKR